MTQVIETLKVMVAKPGSRVEFINNGRINVAPHGATIIGYTSGVAMKVNPSLQIELKYNVEVINPTNGATIKLQVEDWECPKIVQDVEVTVMSPWSTTTFNNDKGVKVEGVVQSVYHKNLYNKLASFLYNVQDEVGTYFQNCTMYKEEVWGK
jgi:hypothetical protein